MASRKFKTYCRITDYMDSVDSEFSELIRGTCADLALNSTKGVPGKTLLWPQDKAYKEKIAKLAYSDKVEDANKASDMINALIIRDVFKAPSEWLARKDDIPNSLMPSQRIEIDSVSGNEVIFKSGAKAVLDKDFQDASRKKNLAVWKLSGGEIPVTSDKPATHKYSKMNKGKTGGYDVSNLASQSERFKIAVSVENAYVLHELARRTGGGQKHDNIYLRYTLSLIKFLRKSCGDEFLYNNILALLSLDKVDFYILLEPHKFGGQYLINDMLIHEWWVNKDLNFDMSSCIEEIDSMLKPNMVKPEYKQYLAYSGRDRIMEALSQIRLGSCQNIDARPRNCVEIVDKIYDALDQTNAIGGLGPIYPPGISAFYANEPGLKMLHDELRYLTFGAFCQLEEDRHFDMGKFHELVNMIGDYLHAATKEDKCRVTQLLNKNCIKYQIAPIEKIQEIKIFINSTMFMHFAMTYEECKNLESVTKRPNPNNIKLFNIAKVIHMRLYAQHRRLLQTYQSEQPSKDVANLLMSLDVKTLDPLLLDELRKKLAISA